MTETKSDRERYTTAAFSIVGGRDPETDLGAIMVTLEGAVAAVLIYAMGSPEKAAAMLNERLVPGVEARLARYGARKG